MINIRYNDTFYHTETLNQCAKLYLKHLPREVNWLICRGSSGQMIASAMMVKSKRMLRTIVVRKNEEVAHSVGFAGQYGWDDRKNNIICFVDDFCVSGSTLKSVMFKARNSHFYDKIKYVLVDHIDNSYETRSRFPQLKFLELEDLEAM
jgi:hypothetical protein